MSEYITIELANSHHEIFFSCNSKTDPHALICGKMSRMEVIYRSIEHIIVYFFRRRFYLAVPVDLTHVMELLTEEYKDNAMMIISLQRILDFRNSWAHNNVYEAKGICIALDEIVRELERCKVQNDILTVLVATTRELILCQTEHEVNNKKESITEKKESENGRSFTDSLNKSRYTPMTFFECRENPSLKDFIKE
jgi:hypothetical protein